MYEKTEKFHKTDSSFDFISIVFIHPDNSVSFCHDYFPNYLFRNICWVKESIIGDSRNVMFLFQFYKIASTHPKVINMPSFENVSKILSVKKSLESSLTVNNVDPKTSMKISHRFKSLPKRLTLMNLNVTFKISCLE